MNKFEITLKDESVVELDTSIFVIDEEKGMVNLTKIAKACGKRLDHWLSNDSTKAYIEALDGATRDSASCISTENGNGTWGSRELAIEFAMWISPCFKVWCVSALDELFQKGSVSLNQPQTIQEAMQVVIDMQQAEIEKEEQRKKMDTSRIRYQNFRKRIMKIVDAKTNKASIERITHLVLLEDVVNLIEDFSYIYTSGINFSKIVSKVLGEEVYVGDIDDVLSDIGWQYFDEQDNNWYETADAESFTNGTRFMRRPNFHIIHACVAICEELLLRYE